MMIFANGPVANNSIQRPQCIDATRMKDGVFVFIKRVGEDADETEIQRYLTDDQKKGDPKNHCCPILDVFRDAEDEGYEYVVLPVLRDFDDPKFYAVIEVLDFVKQTLEVTNVSPDSLIFLLIYFPGS